MGDQPPREPVVIDTFEKALAKLTQFNRENQQDDDFRLIGDYIGNLKDSSSRLSRINGNLKSMLEKIKKELSNMNQRNFQVSRDKLREHVTSIARNINQIENILPVTDEQVQPPQPPQAGGYKYTKSRSKSKSKSKRRSTRRRRRR